MKQHMLSEIGSRRIDLRNVCSLCGYLLLVEAVILLIPLIVSILVSDGDMAGFVMAGGAALLSGIVLCWIGGFRPNGRMSRREGYLVTSLAWVIFSFVGMIPYLFCSHPLDISAAYFETMSGFTTTGATTIADVESMSVSILLWRSMTQWLGGLGIVIFMLALLPWLNQSGSIPLFNAEATGITHDKIHPRIRQTAASLWKVYISLTLLLFLLLWAGPMSFFDALCQALTTMSTGGFSTRNASIAGWNSDYIAWVVTIFMFIGGVNFMLIYALVKGNWKVMWHNDVFRAYLVIIAVFYVAMTGSLVARGDVDSVGDALLYPLFQIATTITTTGFSYGAYGGWGNFMYFLIWTLMLMGACAGSTTGAIKIDRLLTMYKDLSRQKELTLYPRHIITLEVNGKVVSDGQQSRISMFFVTYLLLLLLGAVVMSAYGFDPADCCFAAASCIGNNGLGYGLTESGFGVLPGPVKWFFSALMLVGRLEIFTVVVLFSRRFWR